jgi:CYTH domain-containing protein
LELCTGTVITKTRYCVPVGAHVFEVDVFEGANAGLIVAEVELEDPDEYFEKPAWLGQEVTGDPKYYNAQLSINTYDQWHDIL